jgi:hypothetical protein
LSSTEIKQTFYCDRIHDERSVHNGSFKSQHGYICYDITYDRFDIYLEGLWYQLDTLDEEPTVLSPEQELESYLRSCLGNFKDSKGAITINPVAGTYNLVNSSGEQSCNILSWHNTIAAAKEPAKEAVPIAEYLKIEDFGKF